jgi:hypothetical protein
MGLYDLSLRCREIELLKEYDSVKLVRPLPDADIPLGSHGVVLIVYEGKSPDYEVEFFDRSGNSVGNFTTDGNHIERRIE